MKIIEKNIKKKNNKCYISFEERLMIEKMLSQNIACNFRLGEDYDSSELLEVLKNGQLDTILVCPHCYDLILNQEFDNEVIVPDDEGFVPHDEDYELDSEEPDPSDYFGLDFDFIVFAILSEIFSDVEKGGRKKIQLKPVSFLCLLLSNS